MAAPTESDLEITHYHFQMQVNGSTALISLTARCKHKTEKWTGEISFPDKEIVAKDLPAAKKQLLQDLDTAIRAKVKKICAKRAEDVQAGNPVDEEPIRNL